MSHRRGGRPRGPERIPFTTTLLPGAREELARRAAEAYGTDRAANRVIEEAMGFAAVQWSESEEVDLTIERDDWTDEVTVSVLLCANGDDRIESVTWHGGAVLGKLTPAEEQRAIEGARRKAAES